MGFQVSLCATINSSLITVSIRPDVISPCIVSLDLIATVTSGRASEHTFLWEQISGSQVVFITPVNQLFVSCTLLDSTDKVFYFWVDKGTAKEVYYIFNYRGTATETTALTGSNTFICNGLQIDNGSPICSTIFATQQLFIPPTSGSIVINDPNLVLRWNLPTNIVGLQGLQVEQIINGVWVSVLTLLPTDPQILLNAINNANYRIKTTYIIDGGRYSQYSCVYCAAINTANYNAYVDDIISSLGNNTVTTPGVVNYTLITSDMVTSELLDIIPVTGVNIIQGITTTLYTLITSDMVTSELLDIIPVTGVNTITRPVVVYLGGTTIGG